MAIQLFNENIDKQSYRSWDILSGNIETIEVDLKKIHQYMYHDIKKVLGTEITLIEELMQVMFHPQNIDKFAGWGF